MAFSVGDIVLIRKGSGDAAYTADSLARVVSILDSKRKSLYAKPLLPYPAPLDDIYGDSGFHYYFDEVLPAPDLTPLEKIIYGV